VTLEPTLRLFVQTTATPQVLTGWWRVQQRQAALRVLLPSPLLLAAPASSRYWCGSWTRLRSTACR
jgi:gamma-glutamyl:cysteine ligase YbdK (ATP-grasp superfamily)